jgi:hypothetical protein
MATVQIADCRLPIAEEFRSGIWIDTARAVRRQPCTLARCGSWPGTQQIRRCKFHRRSPRSDYAFPIITRALDSQTRAQIFHQFQSTLPSRS